MTKKVFWDDPYRTELATRVTGAAGGDVTLAETIFFAESGGQESDAGTIGGARVLGARWQGREIVYTLPAGHGLSPGDRVTMRIDWDRRYRLMRLHFAAELVLELICRARPGIGKIGAYIAENKARIDFEMNANISVLFPEIEAEVAAIAAADMAIASAFSDVASERRYWRIEGLARVPCGGTHPRRTGEVGPVALKRRNIGKGKERVEIRVG